MTEVGIEQPNNSAQVITLSRRRMMAIWVAIAALFLLMIRIGSVLLMMVLRPKLASTHGPTVDGNLTVTAEESNVSKIVNQVSPSVVSIITVKSNGFRSQENAGTGVIISKDGYILTNKHVVNGGRSFQIITGSGDRHTNVKLVGVDPLNDIAFLKINGVDNLSPATIGDSSTVRVGQKVIAIGNSLGKFQNTVTSGIISGKGRPLQASSDSDDDQDQKPESLTDLLQTDAAINPGNSGGPLLNMAGQVIGINTAIVEDAQSIGFAIPIGAAKGLIRSVLEKGEINKSYIGIRYLEVTPETRAANKLSVKHGAFVGGVSGQLVQQGGPADKAGIKSGDIITKVNDKTIGEHGGLTSLIGEYLPGETIELTVIRDNREQKLRLTLGAYKS